MIVVDASAMIEALVGRNADDGLLDALQSSVHGPHLLDMEVLSVLRGLTLSGKLSPDAADAARTDYFDLTIARYEVHGLADRIWDLRHNYTIYDACYVALAEALDAPLYTCDHKLAADGHTADVPAPWGSVNSPPSLKDSAAGRALRSAQMGGSSPSVLLPLGKP